MKLRCVIDLGPNTVLCAACKTCIPRANLDKHFGSREHRHNLDAVNAERHRRHDAERREAVA